MVEKNEKKTYRIEPGCRLALKRFDPDDTGERARAEARFDRLAPPTVAEAMADPEALAAHHLARCTTGLTAAEAAEDAVEEVIGRLEEELLASPAANQSDLAADTTPAL